MTRKMMQAVLLVAAGALMLAGAACSDDDDDQPSAGGAESQLCADLDALGSALGGVQDLSLDSTADDLRALRDEIESALEGVRESASSVGDARVSDIEQAYDEFDQAIDSITSDTSLSDAFETILDGAAAVLTAYGDVFSSLDC